MVGEEEGEDEEVVCQRRHQDRQWMRKRARAEWGSKRGVQGTVGHVVMGQRWYCGAGVQGVLWRGRAMRGWELGCCQLRVRVLAGTHLQVWVKRRALGGV